MEIEHLDLPGLMLVTPRVFEDGRGSFSEMFNEREFQRRTGVDFRVVQVNRSVSAQINTIRGLHAQMPPDATRSPIEPPLPRSDSLSLMTSALYSQPR